MDTKSQRHIRSIYMHKSIQWPLVASSLDYLATLSQNQSKYIENLKNNIKKMIKSEVCWDLTGLSPKFIVIIIENKTLDSSPGSGRKQFHCSCPLDSEACRSQPLLWYCTLIRNMWNMIIPRLFVTFNHYMYCWIGTCFQILPTICCY